MLFGYKVIFHGSEHNVLSKLQRRSCVAEMALFAPVKNSKMHFPNNSEKEVRFLSTRVGSPLFKDRKSKPGIVSGEFERSLPVKFSTLWLPTIRHFTKEGIADQVLKKNDCELGDLIGCQDNPLNTVSLQESWLLTEENFCFRVLHRVSHLFGY